MSQRTDFWTVRGEMQWDNYRKAMAHAIVHCIPADGKVGRDYALHIEKNFGVLSRQALSHAVLDDGKPLSASPFSIAIGFGFGTADLLADALQHFPDAEVAIYFSNLQAYHLDTRANVWLRKKKGSGFEVHASRVRQVLKEICDIHGLQPGQLTEAIICATPLLYGGVQLDQQFIATLENVSAKWQTYLSDPSSEQPAPQVRDAVLAMVKHQPHPDLMRIMQKFFGAHALTLDYGPFRLQYGVYRGDQDAIKDVDKAEQEMKLQLEGKTLKPKSPARVWLYFYNAAEKPGKNNRPLPYVSLLFKAGHLIAVRPQCEISRIRALVRRAPTDTPFLHDIQVAVGTSAEQAAWAKQAGHFVWDVAKEAWRPCTVARPVLKDLEGLNRVNYGEAMVSNSETIATVPFKKAVAVVLMDALHKAGGVTLLVPQEDYLEDPLASLIEQIQTYGVDREAYRPVAHVVGGERTVSEGLLGHVFSLLETHHIAVRERDVLRGIRNALALDPLSGTLYNLKAA